MHLESCEDVGDEALSVGLLVRRRVEEAVESRRRGAEVCDND